MPKPQKYRDVIKFLKSQGWVFLRDGKGSHEIWGDPNTGAKISIPAHREVSAGIVRLVMQHFPNAPKNWR